MHLRSMNHRSSFLGVSLTKRTFDAFSEISFHSGTNCLQLGFKNDFGDEEKKRFFFNHLLIIFHFGDEPSLISFHTKGKVNKFLQKYKRFFFFPLLTKKKKVIYEMSLALM